MSKKKETLRSPIRWALPDDNGASGSVDSDLFGIPLCAIRGSALPTRADVGGWLPSARSPKWKLAKVSEVETKSKSLVSSKRSTKSSEQRTTHTSNFSGSNSGSLFRNSDRSFGVSVAHELETFIEIEQAVPDFSVGDTIRVCFRVAAGTSTRLQNYEGVCIARDNSKGIAGSFTVRRISFGVGVEMVFPLYSTQIESLTITRRRRVRRAKLYYLRKRRSKSARIVEIENKFKKDH